MMKPTAKLAAATILAILLPFVGSAPTSAQSYTVSPPPFLTVFDNSGNIVAGGCVWTYAAGTSTPATTYSTSSGTPNANPIVADASGRFTAYLTAGASYKLVYENVPCSSSSHGAILRTADNIAATPASSVGVDITGTAGEAITAGQAVYLSDGSGGKNAGQWYKADSANVYSSVSPSVGIATTTISAASSGTVRIGGSVSGLSSLSISSTYFIGTAGAITTTPPTNRRILGIADTATSLVLTPWPLASAPPNPGLAQGRLTLTSGTPVTTSDVTAASTVYYTPYTGSSLSLFDGTATWNVRTFAELSVALSGLVTAQAYDVFAYDNSGAPALETAEWANATVTMTIAAPGVITWTGHGLATGNSITFTTSGALPTGLTANTQYFVTVVDANTFKVSTTLANVTAGTFITTSGTQSGTHTGHQPQARQTALVLQNGVYVKTGATTRRYLGSFFTTGTGTTEDSYAKRFVWNYYNRKRRPLERAAQTASWVYTLASFQQANADPLHQLSMFCGLQEDAVWVQLSVGFSSDQAAGTITATAAIGEDTTSSASGFAIGGAASNLGAANGIQNLSVIFQKPITVGYHTLLWLNKSTATGATTWYGTASGGAGLWGWIEG